MDSIYWHMNATQGGANLHTSVNLHPEANLHPGANCAYEHSLSLLHLASNVSVLKTAFYQHGLGFISS